jgi:hypothetical protein
LRTRIRYIDQSPEAKRAGRADVGFGS